MTENVRHLPVACNRDCGGGCPLVATVEGGRVTRIASNPAAGPFLKGCVRGYRAYLQQQAPDRLAAPLIRTGPQGSGQFCTASWDEALDRVAEELKRVRERHGNEAILALGGSGSCRGALHDTEALTARFLNLFGGHVGEANTYSSAADAFAGPVVLGTPEAGVDPATLQHSALILLWGANIVDCIMGCEWRARVRQAKRRGVPVVVVDPRRTETVRQLGTEWLPVRPGTDSALMLAVLHVLVTEGLADEAFVATHATGWDALRRRVLGGGGAEATTPEWAEAVCGTPAARIVALAREWARRRPAALVPGLSIQRTWGGEEAVRLAIALQVATGNLGRLGGSSGGRTWGGLPHPRFEGVPVPPNPVGVGIPANDWADAILRGRAGGHPVQPRAAYVVGCNYVAQAADVRKSLAAMKALEFTVCHDLFMTSTARHCDVVLPVTHWLEREDVIFTSANYLLFSHKVADPPGRPSSVASGEPAGVAGLPEGPHDDYAVFAALAARTGLADAFTEGRDEAAWLRDFIARSEVPDEAAFRESGMYFAPDQQRVGLAAFAGDPERYPLATPSGKVELAGAACVAAGLSEVPEARVMPRDDARPLFLVTPKSRYRVHSQLDDIPWFHARDDRALSISPGDAAERDIPGDGQGTEARDLHADREDTPVLVTSAQGTVRCAARVTDDIMPGVVSLCEGIEPEAAQESGDEEGRGTGVDLAGAANVLTSDRPTLPSRGATMHSTFVEVRRAD